MMIIIVIISNYIDNTNNNIDNIDNDSINYNNIDNNNYII